MRTRLPAYDAALERAASLLRELVLRRPPNAGGGILELIGNAGLGRQLFGLSLEDKRLLLDLFTKSAADYLAHWFESDVVKGAFAFDGIVGAYASPYTPGTAYVLLHHCFGEVNGKSGVWGHALGGMGAITQAMARAAEARGARIRTNAGVAGLIVEGGKATGVRLEFGERIEARVVAANVGPKLLFRDLVPEGVVEPELHRRFTGIKSGSGTFRMNVALSELPDFVCRPGKQQQDHHGSGIVIGPTLDYLERAYLDARTHGWARQPVVEMLIPSTLDPSLAPAGRHVASLFVQHVAPQLPERSQLGRRQGRIRRRRDRHGFGARPQLQGQRAGPAGTLAPGPGAAFRPAGWRHLPRPAEPGPIVQRPPGPWLCRLPHAAAGPLPVRVRRPSRRRRDGCSRTQCSYRDSARLAPSRLARPPLIAGV